MCKSGACTALTIQEALDGIGPTTTERVISVTDGETYDESLMIVDLDGIELTSASATNPFRLRGNGLGAAALTISSSDSTTFRDFIIDGRGIAKGVSVDTSYVTLFENVEITHGKSGSGAGIGMYDAQVRLTGCEVHDNDGTVISGALSANASVLDLDGGTVFGWNTGNSVGGLHLVDTHLTSVGTTFSDNFGTTSSGALYVDGSSIVTLDGDLFQRNTGKYGGHAAFGYGTTVTSKQTHWEDGVADGGGAIQVRGGAVVTLQGDSFLRSIAPSGGAIVIDTDGVLVTQGALDGTPTTFTLGYASSDGGAIRVALGGVAEIDSAVFTENSSYLGGAISAQGAKSLSVGNSAFTGNISTHDGGAVFLTDSAGSLGYTFTGCSFSGNEANTSGGAIRWIGNAVLGDIALTISECTFTANQAGNGAGLKLFGAREVRVLDSTFEGNLAESNGGAISLDSVVVAEVRRNHFCSNDAGGSGGAIHASDVTLPDPAATETRDRSFATWTNNVFADNSAGDLGGAILGNQLVVTLDHNTIVRSSAAAGGGFWVIYSDYTFTWSLVAESLAGGGFAHSNPVFKLFDRNHWAENLDFHANVSLSERLTDTESTTSPLVFDNPGLPCDQRDFRIAWDSPLRDVVGGSPADPDGSLPDIGAYGGPQADPGLFVDGDSDGVVVMWDCNDSDGGVGPGELWYPDDDADGAGDGDAPLRACEAPNGGVGWVANADDCDDSDPGLIDTLYWYEDGDGDGYGTDGTGIDSNGDGVHDETGRPIEVIACDDQPGYVRNNLDCNDRNSEIDPDALEVCDEVDQDCDGFVDEDATDAETWFLDADGDDYGADPDLVDLDEDGLHDATDAVLELDACDAPVGYTDNTTDCDDDDPLRHPGTEWFMDEDFDGWGGPGPTQQSCEDPGDGWADRLGDCNDEAPGIHPDAEEVCNGLDDDCDDVADGPDALGAVEWFKDGDGDGYGTPSSTRRGCEQPVGFVEDDTDCDDEDADSYPGAPDPWYDGVDQDCAGGDDYDQDGDGFPSADELDGGTDCNDTDPAVNPGAEEILNDGEDQDCNGFTEDSFVLGGGGGCECSAGGATPRNATAVWWLLTAMIWLRRRR